MQIQWNNDIQPFRPLLGALKAPYRGTGLYAQHLASIVSNAGSRRDYNLTYEDIVGIFLFLNDEGF
jgi:hypothetical protein